MNTKLKPVHLHIVGAGGIGSYLLPVLIRCSNYMENITAIGIHDGDIIEERNLDRQAFTHDDIGENKAIALSAKHAHFGKVLVQPFPEYLINPAQLEESIKSLIQTDPTTSTGQTEPKVIVIGCADNNKARQTIIQYLDEAPNQSTLGIIGANEVQSAEAYVVLANREETTTHPYSIFPELKFDDGQSPVVAAGCTGDAAIEAAPQLPLANFKAAEAIIQLLNAWVFPAKEFSQVHLQITGILHNMPILISKNEYHTNEKTYGQFQTQNQNHEHQQI